MAENLIQSGKIISVFKSDRHCSSYILVKVCIHKNSTVGLDPNSEFELFQVLNVNGQRLKTTVYMLVVWGRNGRQRRERL